MPRHPPNALTTLNRSHCQCSSSRCRFQRKRSAGRVTFYNPTKPMMPSTCSIDLLYWNYAEQFACSLSLRPASRDWIRYRAVRQRQSSRPSDAIPKDCKQQRPRATSFLPTSSPSTISSRLGHPWFHQNWARTPGQKPDTWKPPDQSSLHDICRTGIRPKPMQNFISSKDIFNRRNDHPNTGQKAVADRSARRPQAMAVRTEFGGAERDRTADPLLAKQVLSQLSYSPNHRNT